MDAEEASHLMGALDFNAAVKELAAAVAFLKAEGSPQVGLTGFCMGGALTLAAASKGVEVKCIQPFYGIPPKEHFDVTAITVPVLVRLSPSAPFAGDTASVLRTDSATSPWL